jgi:hypothetical protein
LIHPLLFQNGAYACRLPVVQVWRDRVLFGQRRIDRSQRMF